MAVALRKRENKDGSQSLFLDIYHNKKRHKEYLTDCKLLAGTSPKIKSRNRDIMLLAESIALKRSQELISGGFDVATSFKTDVDFVAYCQAYIDRYTKKDKRNMEGVFNRFKDFMKKEGIKSLTMKQLSETHVYNFAEYLKETSTGEGANSYFARFKKILKYAQREKVLINNPASDISIKREVSLAKDVLTMEEIGLLAKTDISNTDIKNAFLFSCFTGLSWVDAKELKWKHIDLKNTKFAKVRAKTGTLTEGYLNDTALKFLPEQNKSDALVFNLPTHTGASKALLLWLKKAGIEKHITWHCARHSFATNLIYYKNDVTIVSKLLGHASLQHTQRYTHIAEEMKRNAINNLPKLD